MDPSLWSSRRRVLAATLMLLGLYLTLRGYHSRDGDQAFRLPLLLHQQSPSLYEGDPFVTAFHAFNPHRGYLAVLDLASRIGGLSLGLFGLFAATFALTCVGVGRLSHQVAPDPSRSTGAMAVVLLLMAKAGNIGTNHLFEAMLLDRLMAMALGWLALGDLLEQPKRTARASCLIGMALVIHPAMGLQVGSLLTGGLILWGLAERQRGAAWRGTFVSIVGIVLAMVPGSILMMSQKVSLTVGLSSDDFYALSALIQSPQHMIPHLWRMNQWIAWACYPVLVIATAGTASSPANLPRRRLLLLLALNLCGLLVSWVGIEILRSISLTAFQPFRMATTARGLCLVLIAEHVRALWTSDRVSNQCRASLLVFGISGDLAFIVATVVELGALMASRMGRRAEVGTASALLILGLVYLSRHDTESGQWPLLLAILVVVVRSLVGRWTREWCWRPRRVAFACVACWVVPGLALVPSGWLPPKVSARLTSHCRFGETPVDDVERLAVWCRDNTPSGARFVTPPGPKTFRLWSRREVAFNRASGPYHALGLADWADRYRDHVGFAGNLAEFARAYLRNRQDLDRGFDAMDARGKATLARRQGAHYLVSKRGERASGSGLSLLHEEGRYAVYRVLPEARDALTRRENLASSWSGPDAVGLGVRD